MISCNKIHNAIVNHEDLRFIVKEVAENNSGYLEEEKQIQKINKIK